jgi:hypothetical protein
VGSSGGQDLGRLAAIGVATIVAGIFDHRSLVRAYGPATDLNPESSDVAA